MGKREQLIAALRRELASTRAEDVDAILAQLERLGAGEPKPKRTTTAKRSVEKRG